jgi:NADH-quinone oxidoreductase subunit F
VNGAEQLCEQLERRFGAEGASVKSNGAGVTWQRSPCLGLCDQGSAAMIQQAGGDPARVVLAPVDPDQVQAPL